MSNKKGLGFNFVGEFEDTDPISGATSLTDDERFTTEVLVSYLWNPWWALYVGYNSSACDFQLCDDESLMLPDASKDGQQIFFKFSYLFQL